MGLDMYLLAQRKGKKVDGQLCCMNGFMPFAISTDKEQIGYWRKAYSVSAKLFELLGKDDEDCNCVPLPVSKEILEKMLSISKELVDEVDNEWEQQDWTDSVDIFSNALDILEKEPDTEIFYEVWY